MKVRLLFMSPELNSLKIQQRVRGLSLVECELGLSLDEIIKGYEGEFFSHSDIRKSDFFRQCLEMSLSEASQKLVAERCRLDFHKDARSTIEYGLELVFGWLSEDLILKALTNLGYAVELFGSDRNRDFLKASDISTSSDFKFRFGNLERKLEIVFSWNGTWARTNTWDLRDSKFHRLTANANDSLCLGVELPTLNGFILDLTSQKDRFSKRINPAWGNKYVYSLTNMRKYLKPLAEVLEDLKKFG
jgi:hypothetical protein